MLLHHGQPSPQRREREKGHGRPGLHLVIFCVEGAEAVSGKGKGRGGIKRASFFGSGHEGAMEVQSTGM